MKRNGSNFIMHACPRCGGAAYCEDLQENEWRCLTCARSVPAPDLQSSQPESIKAKAVVRAA